MKIIADVLVAAVALAHLYILVLEMFLWRSSRGRAAFGPTQEFADATATMAGKPGLYNGFVATGLLWGLVAGHAAFQFKIFFLACVVVAGLYGAATGVRKALFGQTVPAAIAAVAVLIAG